MALVVTPSSPSATSYSTRAAAVARAAIDPRGTTFLTLDGEVQDQLLAMGALDIDAALLASGRLRAASATTTQALVLPLAGQDTILTAAVLANQLLAFHYADRQSLGEIGVPIADTSNIKEKTSGPLTTVRFSPAEMGRTTTTVLDGLPAHVRGYLEPFLRQTSVAWGQGIVQRTS